MSLTRVELAEAVKTSLEITKVHASFSGAQKDVFIVTRKEQKVAIKLFKQGLLERERREIDFYLSHAKHNGIPKMIEILELGSHKIVIEEYIEGNRLEDIKDKYIRDHDKISKLINSICDIMEPFWAEDIVHRDLKPENIIIKNDDSPVVIDFGIYKNPDITTITETGFQPNTCCFASPEQLITKIGKISYRSDYFSLGIIAFFLFFGVLPFGNDKTKITSHFEGDQLWPVPDRQSPFDKFFESVFQKRPSMRVRTTPELKEMLP